MFKGELLSIHIAPASSCPMLTVTGVRALAGSGLEGDRYSLQLGLFSELKLHNDQVTLIESEALAALERDYQITLRPEECRRNLVTRGVPLNHLVGRRFRVGGVWMEGVELSEPCGHLENLCGQPVRKGLQHRGGLRARILNDGLLEAGASIELGDGP